MKAIIVSIIIIALAGLAFFFWSSTDNEEGQDVANADGVVATFSGEEITRAQLDAYVAGLAENPQVTVPDASQEVERAEFDRAALEQMINEQLFIADAQAQGVSVDADAVDARLAEVAAQFETEEDYQAELAAAGITEDVLRANIRQQLLITGYYEKLSAENEVSVSDEEVQAFYDEQITDTEANPFEDVAEQIEAFLAQQKLQVIVDGVIEKLRENANIQLLI